MNRVSDSKALTEWMELARTLGAQLFELWERPAWGSKRRVFGLEADGSDEASDLYERIERRRLLQDASTSFVVRACGEDGEPLAEVFIASTPPAALLALAHHEGPNGVSPGSGEAARQTRAVEVRSLANMLNNAFARTLAAPAEEREALFRTLDLESTFGFFQLYCDWVDDTSHDAAPPAVVAAALSGKPKRSP